MANYNTLGPNRAERSRIGGSGYTVFAWEVPGGKEGPLVPIAFARQISHQSPTAVGPGTTPIHPMDEPYPVELITAIATTMGTITLEFYERFDEPVWAQLAGLGASVASGSAGVSAPAPVDLANIFKIVANLDNPIRIIRFIREPKRGTTGGNVYTTEYNNVVVSQIMDGETIEVGSMEVLKQVVVNYTHITKDGGYNGLLGTRANRIAVNSTGINQIGIFTN